MNLKFLWFNFTATRFTVTTLYKNTCLTVQFCTRHFKTVDTRTHDAYLHSNSDFLVVCRFWSLYRLLPHSIRLFVYRLSLHISINRRKLNLTEFLSEDPVTIFEMSFFVLNLYKYYNHIQIYIFIPYDGSHCRFEASLIGCELMRILCGRLQRRS